MKKTIADFIEENFELSPGEKIKLYPYQKDILLCKSKFRIINKSRQVGISSLVAWEALAYALLKPNQTILFISVSERQASELMNYVKRVLYNLKRKERIILLEETKTLIRFDNNSRIISLPNSPTTVQGFRADRIYIDEFALFENDKRMLEAILPSISHGGYITLISRPFGTRGEFYRLWKEAKQNKNNFVPFEIPYKECPSQTFQEMIKEIKKTMDEVSFRESYCCEFVDEASSFFPYELILSCVDENITHPRPEMCLRIGVDFGRKQNSTVITVTEVKGGMFIVRQIKEFLGVSYTAQLMYLNKRIKELKPEIVNVDEFGVGIRLFEELREKHGSLINPIQLTAPTKDRLITDLRILFEDKKIRIPRNEKLLQQLHALKKTIKGGYIKWEPGKTEDFGKHDDYVWSLAVAVAQKPVPQLKYFKVGEVSTSAVGYDRDFKTTLLEDDETYIYNKFNI